MIEIWASQLAQELVLNCDRGSWIEPIGDQRSKKLRETKKWLRGFWQWIIKVAIKGQREWGDRRWVVSVRRSRVNPHKIIDSDRCCPPKLYGRPGLFCWLHLLQYVTKPLQFLQLKKLKHGGKGYPEQKGPRKESCFTFCRCFSRPLFHLWSLYLERESLSFWSHLNSCDKLEWCQSKS